MSTMIAPFFAPSRIPPSPRTTSSTSGPSGSMVKITSARAPTSLFDAPRSAPSATHGSSTLAVRVYATTECPAFSRFFIMGRPMMPSPTNPSFATTTLLSKSKTPATTVPEPLHVALLFLRLHQRSPGDIQLHTVELAAGGDVERLAFRSGPGHVGSLFGNQQRSKHLAFRGHDQHAARRGTVDVAEHVDLHPVWIPDPGIIGVIVEQLGVGQR